MGKTISITIPTALEKELQDLADKIGISRSRFIGNILLRWQEKRTVTVEATKIALSAGGSLDKNDCPKHNDEGFCSVYEHICIAPQHEANTCEGYPKE